MPADPDLGDVHSQHRPSGVKAAGHVLLILFCLAVAVALTVVAARQDTSKEMLERGGMAALFFAGGGILGFGLVRNLQTAVDLGQLGLRHTLAGRVTTLRWDRLQHLEVLTINGRVRSLTFVADGARLVLNSSLSNFDGLLEFLRARRLLKR